MRHLSGKACLLAVESAANVSCGPSANVAAMLCFAAVRVADPDLKEWVKEREPFVADHMSGLPINCFRDPFVLEKPSADNDWRWRIMVCAGGAARNVWRLGHNIAL